jgi:hypothetical protein
VTGAALGGSGQGLLAFRDFAGDLGMALLTAAAFGASWAWLAPVCLFIAGSTLARGEAGQLAPWAWFLEPDTDAGAWAAAAVLLAAGWVVYARLGFRPESNDAEI